METSREIARELHIGLLGRLHRKARDDQSALRLQLSKEGNRAMNLVILDLACQLSDLGALECDCCEKWFHESQITVSEQNTTMLARSRADQVMETVHTCQDCIDCPPDRVEDPVPASEFK